LAQTKLFRLEQQWQALYSNTDNRKTKRPYRLVVIPSDPLQQYVDKGRGNLLEDYYNPLKFFDEVYVLSPKEKKKPSKMGNDN